MQEWQSTLIGIVLLLALAGIFVIVCYYATQGSGVAMYLLGLTLLVCSIKAGM